MRASLAVAILLSGALSVRAHVAAFGPGMYCKNVSAAPDSDARSVKNLHPRRTTDSQYPNAPQGLSTEIVNNTNEIVEPLYGMKRNEWWMHGACKYFQPPEGEFLELCVSSHPRPL